MSKIKLVVFDLDGTLFDGPLDFAEIRTELKLKQGMPILEHLETLTCEQTKASYHQRVREIEEVQAGKGNLKPAAIKLFEHLESLCIPMAIWTRNSPAATKISLNTHFDRFFKVLTREDAKPKPHPQGMLDIIKQAKVSLNETLFVGDSIFDIRAGEAVGVKTVIINNALAAQTAPSKHINFAEDLAVLAKFL